ncbi:MAG TPA: oxygenase MpaB family protein [Luteibacter sp.]|uniref:oxygenase MpaB family protein n=1 Tax=Luteibacter sp. TaxID=1886636 RepID=UPI002BAB184E|nr:oxygenase MpaB family protein [Luteibacter sp.]HVI56387.1 oxygenase MpaB family protein [Luteibacter sp.]
MTALARWLRPASAPIRRWVLSAFPRAPAGGIDYEHPSGDPGLFGPSSVTWRIHSDFCGMLAGGLCALYLQLLHPRALAGVWDHSNFREDLVGRLRRTTAFVGATTYAPTRDAQGMIERVRMIHAKVRGVDEAGLPYSADDPDLLTWVHVSEMSSFLAGYRAYGPMAVPIAVADAYLHETRRIAEALGARDVPGSVADMDAYIAGVLPSLVFGERSRVVLDVLGRLDLPVPMAGLSRDLFLHAGAALLPDWAATLLERTDGDLRKARLASGTLRTLSPLFRVALTEGVASKSCRRVGVDPGLLSHWPS